MKIQTRQFIKAKDTIVRDNPEIDDLVKRGKIKDFGKYENYIFEYNFTSSCIVVGWSDDHIRALNHLKYGPKAYEFIGTRYFRPSEVFNETITIEKNITNLILKNELDYEFRIVSKYDKEIAHLGIR